MANKKLSFLKGAFVFILFFFTFIDISHSKDLKNIIHELDRGNFVLSENELRSYLSERRKNNPCSEDIILAVEKLVYCQNKLDRPYMDLDSVVIIQEDNTTKIVAGKLESTCYEGDLFNALFYLVLLRDHSKMVGEIYNYNLALVLYENGCLSLSEELLKRSIDNKENTLESSLLLSKVYEREGEFKKGMEILDILFENDNVQGNQVLLHKILIHKGVLSYRYWENDSSNENLENSFISFKEANIIRPESIPERLLNEKAVNLTIGFQPGRTDLNGAICGSINIRQGWGDDCIIIEIRPVITTLNGMEFNGGVFGIEDIIELVGNPYFARGITRKSENCGISIDLDTLDKWSETPINAKWGQIQFQIAYITRSGGKGYAYSPKLSLLNHGTFDPEVFQHLYWAGEKNYVPFFKELLFELAEIDSTFIPFVEHNGNDSTYAEFWSTYLMLRRLSIDSTQYVKGFNLWKEKYDELKTFPNYLLMGAIYSQLLYQTDSAVALYEQVIEKDKGNVWAYFNLGLIYYNSNAVDTALKSFQTVIELDTTFALAYICLGIIYEYRFEDYQKAIEMYRKYAQLTKRLEYNVFDWIEDLENKIKNANGDIVD
ncbi:tetratricopeptide repeat protein [bacterium]|nr:tetratricopeptide repeat protein [bacterium]